MSYWWAAMVAFAAVAGAIAWVVTGLMGLGDRVQELHRMAVPGQLVAELEAGKQSVYWESGGRARVEIAVRRVDGPAVPVGPHGGEVTYSAGGHSGESIAGFEITDPGRYLMVVDGREGVVAFGPGVGGTIVRAIVGAIAIFFGGLLLSGLLLIATARRRRR